ncbi:folylpolyglutamate synthase [Coemansia spiralis]|uniref:Folylpolyglutamate synthase n=2 Tax=Coemansia TaxID=4863 RepID=A0A9W8G7G0_9FUNG|nr:folylpolyglutamate synthase [Coemansia umbellata]KAJ2625964.1 folylpolyglutamate synthase [Coemansia sp. RSA 1358]KAJ2680706.1 folylpolyglutamate synthase [Coemansia spiralis]
MAVSENRGRIQLGLERIVRFLEETLPEDPRAKLRVVHVTGTNGKGSVCALISEALTTARYKTGTFNSPHFLEVRDAVRIDGTPPPADEYAELRAWINDLDAAAPSPDGPLSLFEQATVAALWWFSKNDVDIAVIEVGMGGLRDATNVFGVPEGPSSLGVGHSLVQCICSVDEDHLGMIGNNVEEIAFEKAGIIRPGSWVIVARQDHVSAFHKIRQLAHKLSPGRVINVRRQPAYDLLVANFSFKLDDDVGLVLRPPEPVPNWSLFNGTGKRCLRVKYPPSLDMYTTIQRPSSVHRAQSQQSSTFSNSQPSEAVSDSNDSMYNADVKPLSTEADFPLMLPGSHQIENASVAFYALDVLRTQYSFTRLTDAAIQVGFQNVCWPGRLSWVRIGCSTESRRSSLSADPTTEATASNGSSLPPSSRNSMNSTSSRQSNNSACVSLDSWILADGAHNEPAAVELRNYVDTTLRRVTQQRYINDTRGRDFKDPWPVRWIVGLSRGKDIQGILSKLVRPGDTLWAVPFSQPDEMPWVKYEDPDSILSAVRCMKFDSASSGRIDLVKFDSIADVLDQLTLNKSDSHLNVLCGSLYLVSDLYRRLQLQPFQKCSDDTELKQQ